MTLRTPRAIAFDAVLTGFLGCPHLWVDQPESPTDLWHQWTDRANRLIWLGVELATFSALRELAQGLAWA